VTAFCGFLKAFEKKKGKAPAGFAFRRQQGAYGAY